MGDLASDFENDDVDLEALSELGLAAGALSRPLLRSQRTVLLERSYGDGPSPIPWDRDLVLTADVRAFALADLLSLIHTTRKSGYLLFNYEDHEKSVYLHRGEVVFATSNQTVDRLGECLLRDKQLTLEQLHEAERRFSNEGRFGKVLVEIGVLTPRDLWDAVKLQVEEVVRSLFSYSAGEVHFWEGEIEPDNVVRLALPTKRLISEGLKRRDELLRFLVTLEDPGTQFETLGDLRRKLSASESAFMELLDGGDEFSAICHRIGLDPLSAARTVKMLVLCGAVRLVRASAHAVQALDGPPVVDDEALVRESVTNHIKLLAELLSPLIAVEGLEPVGKRLTVAVAEVAERHPKLLTDVVMLPGGLPDPEPLIERALRLAGDRERMVAEALGDIAAYLEFELRNHPKIEDATPYLEAVESLRAKIEV